MKFAVCEYFKNVTLANAGVCL